MNIDETLKLHNEFFQRVGSVEAAAMLTLAHRMGQQPTPKRKPAERDRLTPPEVAKQLGVSADTVRGWISSGALKAVNVAGPGKRPSHLISPDALAEFERRRAPEPAVVRRRRKPAGQLVQRYSA
jgi:excisionase family DNA binding protein